MKHVTHAGSAGRPKGIVSIPSNKVRSNRETAPSNRMDPLLRERRLAADDSVSGYLSGKNNVAGVSTLNQLIPGISIVVLVGAIIFSIVPVHNADVVHSLLTKHVFQ